MRTTELLVTLLQSGVELRVEGSELICRAPKGTSLSTWREELGTHKAEIVALLEPGRKYLQCSFTQERLWFLHQLEPDSPVYNVPIGIRFTGQLNIGALKQALNEIVRRHAILRTTFIVFEGLPAQVISPASDFRSLILEIDLQNLPEADREAEFNRQVSVEARRPFNLFQGPLLCATLFQISDQVHVLLLNLHHIITDGWSMDVFYQEMAALYRAFVAGQPSPLAELTLQYADFVRRQRRWLQGQVLDDQLAYWKEQLRNAAPLLGLPVDHPRPAIQTFDGANYALIFPPTLSESLKALSREAGVTLFMLLLAVFKTLLQRYTGQTDIIVGTPIANRSRMEIEGLIGPFINTLVLRTDLSGSLTFRQLLERVKNVALEAYAHEDLPFERLVEELKPERNLIYSPLFQVMFAVQESSVESLGLPGLSTSRVEYGHDTTKFDLSLYITDLGRELRAVFLYNKALFEKATIRRMAEHLQTLSTGIVADPDQRLADLPLLTEVEREQLLIKWNETRTDYPRASCLHELFHAQVKQTPEAIAVVFEDQALTYQALDRRANQLAHQLQLQGVKAETLVGVCLERSIDLVVSLLGILKAGGAYLPLDPAYPQERLAFMLDDIARRQDETALVVTEQRLSERLPAPPARLVCLDALNWQGLTEEPASAEKMSPDNLAYVMYTSGSTGQPKGSSVTHRNVVHLVKQTKHAHLSETEILLQFAPFSFDASTFEIWGSLLNGARLVIFPAHLPSLAELGEVIQQQRISVLWLTAGLFHQLVEEQLDSLRGGRQVLAGGDVLSAAHVRRVLQQHPDNRLINGYGPTECTTFTCCYPMTTPDQVGEAVPIGWPIADVQVYVLDRHLNPVPIGVPGELYIGGDGLSRGYLNRPDLTAQAFVPHPFSKTGARLYKTGDLVRYLPDGRIEFQGRIDCQVKLRGFRIEPGEIEHVLRQSPAVQDALVLVQDVAHSPGEKRLVGYVIPQAQQAIDVHTLCQFISQKLPEYMIPTAWMVLEAFPLTPNGKVDRRALPAPESSSSQQTVANTPNTPTEILVAEIWQQVFGLNYIGRDENFFALGGHSLLATRVMSRVCQTFKLDLPIRRLFEAPTIAGLAQAIDLFQSIPTPVPIAKTSLADFATTEVEGETL